jgi:two-component system sensor histidine kinase RegB
MQQITNRKLESSRRLSMRWLVRLRWVAIFGQAFAVFTVSRSFALRLPLIGITVALILAIVSNIFTFCKLRSQASISEALLGFTFLLDVFLLTALLYWSGGVENPFNFLYLIYIAQAVVTVGFFWLWAIVVSSCLCFCLLLWAYIPLIPSRIMLDLYPYWHRLGDGTAFVIAACLIAYFLRQVHVAFVRQETALQHERDLNARNEKLVSLATLAAGAAHELSSPLSTIATVSTELERNILKLSQHENVKVVCQDAHLIRQEVDRCRKVLSQMSLEAGDFSGEPFVSVSVRELWQKVIRLLQPVYQEKINLEMSPESQDAQLFLPLTSTTRCIRGIVKNAWEASHNLEESPSPKVKVRVRLTKGMCEWCIQDKGIGIKSDVLNRIGEPFFTTKPPGAGMGLGVFLARNLFERLGGKLEIDSWHQKGTLVTMKIPLATAESVSRKEES